MPLIKLGQKLLKTEKLLLRGRSLYCQAAAIKFNMINNNETNYENYNNADILLTQISSLSSVALSMADKPDELRRLALDTSNSTVIQHYDGSMGPGDLASLRGVLHELSSLSQALSAGFRHPWYVEHFRFRVDSYGKGYPWISCYERYSSNTEVCDELSHREKPFDGNRDHLLETKTGISSLLSHISLSDDDSMEE